eukprot:gb/GECG01001524.1/.p1 GENE.gb/GECG01001524.1/~~gb/GECG01001524.1/.p1  ORF type:complete len:112 (+),score=9.93 gb/GECG01001524.1/:1-336(+)
MYEELQPKNNRSVCVPIFVEFVVFGYRELQDIDYQRRGFSTSFQFNVIEDGWVQAVDHYEWCLPAPLQTFIVEHEPLCAIDYHGLGFLFPDEINIVKYGGVQASNHYRRFV